jgi:hypothetical protein
MAAALLLLACAVVAADAADLAFDVWIEGGSVPEPMQVMRAKQGDIVRLRWRTDRTVVVHLHGYDLERRIEPGTTTEMTFEARATGRFPIVAHGTESGTGGRAREDPLAYVEIYPN